MFTYDDDDHVYDDDNNEGNVSVNSKLQHAPLLFKFPPYPGKNAVQMPLTGVHSGYQMPPTPGTFHRHKNDRRTAETP